MTSYVHHKHISLLLFPQTFYSLDFYNLSEYFGKLLPFPLLLSTLWYFTVPDRLTCTHHHRVNIHFLLFPPTGKKIHFSLLLKNEHICSQHIQACAAGTGRATVPQNDGVSGQVPGWLSPPCLHLQRSITNQHIMPGCDYYTQTGALVSPFLLIGILTCCDFLGWTCLTRIIRPGEWLRTSRGKLCPLPILSCTPSSPGLFVCLWYHLSFQRPNSQALHPFRTARRQLKVGGISMRVYMSLKSLF